MSQNRLKAIPEEELPDTLIQQKRQQEEQDKENEETERIKHQQQILSQQNQYKLKRFNDTIDNSPAFMRIQVNSEDTFIPDIVARFNNFCVTEYPEILSDAPHLLFDLDKGWSKAHDTKPFTLAQWFQFFIDNRVVDWYNTQNNIMLRTKKAEIIQLVGTNNSTATAQALTTIIKSEENQANSGKENNTIFIYRFVPLTDQEKRLNNVEKLSSIPDEINRGIQRIITNTTGSN